MNNLLGLLFSMVFVFLIIGFSTVLSNKKIFDEEGSRKFIHIGFGHWWFIAMYFFDSVLFASMIPLLFIILNYISYQGNVFKAMERREEKTLGTIYYPISLLILVIFTFGFLGIEYTYVGAIGILIMAYGDGFAAIVGRKYGNKKLYQKKTVIGSFAMFIISLTVTSVILLIYNRNNIIINVILIALVATIVELFSKRGLDNITVPIVSSVLFYLIAIL